MKKIMLISLFCLVLDVVSKRLIIHNMVEHQSISVIDSFFSITYAKNTGVAFSFLEGRVSFVVLMTIIFLVFILRYIKVNTLSKIESIFYGMVVGGAIGNLIDRLIYGYVIDFFDFNILGYSFPIFNIADIMIVVGILGLLIFEVKEGSVDDGNSSR